MKPARCANPFAPREVGYYLSPKYAAPGRVDRHIREAYQDPDTGLIYLTDGNGGGLTVLRWTGPIPPRPPILGARYLRIRRSRSGEQWPRHGIARKLDLRWPVESGQ